MSTEENRILAIVGQGYVGLPLAMAAVDAGWTVIGVDNSDSKVAQINLGSSPVEDVTDAQLQSAISKAKYQATSDFSKVAKASVVTICVPTPLNEVREPDLDFLSSAATSIAPFLSNETLVVSESTSYPGTLRDIIIPTIESLKPKEAINIYYATAPERVDPGNTIWAQKNTPRLVGAINQESEAKALAFYESICDSTVSVSTPEVAEAAKLLENTFRLVNIALVNEFAQICSVNRINVNEVIDAASSKPYGFMGFRPGVGVGGHCIPVDPLYLSWWARQHGKPAELVEAAYSINHSMPKYVAQRALAMVNSSIKSPRILILGIAYKSGIGDVRETPANELRDFLEAQGAVVAWHDPLVPVWGDTKPVELSWACDLAILATKQPDMDIEQLSKRGIQILDCTNTIRNQVGVTAL